MSERVRVRAFRSGVLAQWNLGMEGEEGEWQNLDPNLSFASCSEVLVQAQSFTLIWIKNDKSEFSGPVRLMGQRQ